jgi:hypothetical protein
MPDPKQIMSQPIPSTEQDTLPDRGQPARPAQESDSEQDVGAYMANLGAGTGVDIGPGAAGEMGGAAQEPKQLKRNAAPEEYPDSGDLPHLNATDRTS